MVLVLSLVAHKDQEMNSCIDLKLNLLSILGQCFLKNSFKHFFISIAYHVVLEGLLRQRCPLIQSVLLFQLDHVYLKKFSSISTQSNNNNNDKLLSFLLHYIKICLDHRHVTQPNCHSALYKERSEAVGAKVATVTGMITKNLKIYGKHWNTIEKSKYPFIFFQRFVLFLAFPCSPLVRIYDKQDLKREDFLLVIDVTGSGLFTCRIDDQDKSNTKQGKSSSVLSVCKKRLCSLSKFS